jgi:hypothetical protein
LVDGRRTDLDDSCVETSLRAAEGATLVDNAL